MSIINDPDPNTDNKKVCDHDIKQMLINSNFGDLIDSSLIHQTSF